LDIELKQTKKKKRKRDVPWGGKKGKRGTKRPLTRETRKVHNGKGIRRTITGTSYHKEGDGGVQKGNEKM